MIIESEYRTKQYTKYFENRQAAGKIRKRGSLSVQRESAEMWSLR